MDAYAATEPAPKNPEKSEGEAMVDSAVVELETKKLSWPPRLRAALTTTHTIVVS